jgi:Tfp pilus assembly protein PilF/DNA-binding transcriptional MerR regulator
MSGAAPAVGEGYSRQQVLRMLGLSSRQLAAWERQGLVSPPTGKPGEGAPEKPRAAEREAREGLYTFSDLVSLRTLLQLRKEGVPPARIRSLHAALKKKLRGVERPWSELQVQKHGKRLLVHFQGAPLEPMTGQMVLEYSPKGSAAAVRKLERPVRPGEAGETDGKVIAERFFRAGLRYEEHKDTLPKAIRAYQKAIELDARAAGAWINLGTVYYNLGKLSEAERCYRAVLAFDGEHALAHFNLANVFDERQQWDKARKHYEEAIRLNPNSPDPHYNLALVYDKLGLHGRARRQWIEYLKHDPNSQWAVFARQQLEKTAWRVVPRLEPSAGNE